VLLPNITSLDLSGHTFTGPLSPALSASYNPLKDAASLTVTERGEDQVSSYFGSSYLVDSCGGGGVVFDENTGLCRIRRMYAFMINVMCRAYLCSFVVLILFFVLFLLREQEDAILMSLGIHPSQTRKRRSKGNRNSMYYQHLQNSPGLLPELSPSPKKNNSNSTEEKGTSDATKTKLTGKTFNAFELLQEKAALGAIGAVSMKPEPGDLGKAFMFMFFFFSCFIFKQIIIYHHICMYITPFLYYFSLYPCIFHSLLFIHPHSQNHRGRALASCHCVQTCNQRDGNPAPADASRPRSQRPRRAPFPLFRG